MLENENQEGIALPREYILKKKKEKKREEKKEEKKKNRDNIDIYSLLFNWRKKRRILDRNFRSKRNSSIISTIIVR